MLTTATHDHKRGEDSRARIAALSTHIDAWRRFVAQAPDPGGVHPADAYILYQTLVGAWPKKPDATFADRIGNWCRKQLREAKLRSSWQSPDTVYEDAVRVFARRLILEDADFQARIAALLEAIRPQAEANSLVQAVLRYTLPGVPDLYQGCEFADFSLVDPDNRRPVDYAARAAALDAPLRNDSPFDHRKQSLIARLLAARRRDPELWLSGSYEPLPAPEGIVAFRREHQSRSFYVVARSNSRSRTDGTVLPDAGHDVLTGRQIPCRLVSLPMLLESWPACVVLSAELSG